MRRSATLIASVCAARRAARPGRRAGVHDAVADLRGAARPPGPRDARRRPSTRSRARRALDAPRAATGTTSRPQPDSRVKPDVRRDRSGELRLERATTPLVDGARRAGWNVLLTVSGPVPRWATNGAKDNVTRPSPKEFQTFVHAVGRHFGTKVDTWSDLERAQPAAVPAAAVLGRTHTPLSPRIYRKLFLAAQRGLRRRRPRRTRRCCIGETSPRGTGKVVAPLTFLRGVLCLDSKYHKTSTSCAKLHARRLRPPRLHDGARARLFKPKQPNDVTIGVLSRLTTALDRAAKAGAITAHLPIYLTEFGIQSDARPGARRQPRHASPSTARSPSASPTTTRASWPSRSTCCATTRRSRACPPIARYPGFESGLCTNDGQGQARRYDGFRLPLAALRTSARRSRSGASCAPAAGATTATVEVRVQGRLVPAALTTVHDRRARLLHARRGAPPAAARWRLVVDGARRHDVPRDADGVYTR